MPFAGDKSQGLCLGLCLDQCTLDCREGVQWVGLLGLHCRLYHPCCRFLEVYPRCHVVLRDDRNIGYDAGVCMELHSSYLGSCCNYLAVHVHSFAFSTLLLLESIWPHSMKKASSKELGFWMQFDLI